MTKKNDELAYAKFKQRLQAIMSAAVVEGSFDEACRKECEELAYACEEECEENDLRCLTRCTAKARACLRKCRRLQQRIATADALAESRVLGDLEDLIAAMKRAIKS